MTLNTEHVPDFDGLLTKYSILPKFTPSELKDSNNFWNLLVALAINSLRAYFFETMLIYAIDSRTNLTAIQVIETPTAQHTSKQPKRSVS